MAKKTKEGNQKRDQYTVVLEDLRSQFKVFGEALMGVDDKVNGLDKKVNGLKDDVKEIKETQASHTEMIGKLMVDMTEVKNGLKTKVDAKEVLRIVKANI